MNLNLLLRIALTIVLIGIGIKLLKFVTSFLFKAAFIVLIILLICKFFDIF